MLDKKNKNVRTYLFISFVSFVRANRRWHRRCQSNYPVPSKLSRTSRGKRRASRRRCWIKRRRTYELTSSILCLLCLVRPCRPSSTSSLSKLAGAAAFPGLLLVNSVISLPGDDGGAAAVSVAGVVGCGIVHVMSFVWAKDIGRLAVITSIYVKQN